MNSAILQGASAQSMPPKAAEDTKAWVSIHPGTFHAI
jgi:hypothetical protein